jgi:hypothetical protein
LIDEAGGDQAGHTLEGFIEFDSPCGVNCTAANVTDFTFSVSGPTVYSYSYQTAADVDFGQGPDRGFFNAGPLALSVDYHRLGWLGLGNASEGSPYIYWIGHHSSRYVSRGPGLSGGWNTPLFPGQFVAVIGVAIPEPSAVTLMLLACLALRCLVRVRTRY